MCVVPRGVVTKDFWLSEGGECFQQDLKFLCFYFRVKKIKTCWIYKNNVFANWGKYKVSCNFYMVFTIDF